jgi:hypothetical protein
MIHARDDYNRFQDPALDDPSLLGEGCSPIGKNEPVFLFRAKDHLAPRVLEDYANQLRAAGLEDMALTVDRHVKRMQDWQKDHGSKLPDMPK